MQPQDQRHTPWFRRLNETHPFQLHRRVLTSSRLPFSTITPFPWTKKALRTLWQGAFYDKESNLRWYSMIREFWDAVAVSNQEQAYVIYFAQRKAPIKINLSRADAAPGTNLLPSDSIHVQWTVRPLGKYSIDPLLLISKGRLLWLFSLRTETMVGHLHGHGNTITSIAVHPLHPHIFCTTSRDLSARIYDLCLEPQQGPPLNDVWPPVDQPSLTGAAHGLHTSEGEGIGIGRCIIVLMGGQSGGHQAAVLAAAFHPQLPLIATCGEMDRCVKIWTINPLSSMGITREDKPLFSTSRIHRARVLSINWLNEDVLISHSAPTAMAMDTLPNEEGGLNSPPETHLEPGQVVIWRWLALHRFFPSTWTRGSHPPFLRGNASDYHNSGSFKVAAAFLLPELSSQLQLPHVNIYKSPTCDPLIVLTEPASTETRILNITKLSPRPRPQHPTSELSLGALIKAQISPQASPQSWSIQLKTSKETSDPSSATLHCATLSCNSAVLLTAGSGGCILVWKREERTGTERQDTPKELMREGKETL